VITGRNLRADKESKKPRRNLRADKESKKPPPPDPPDNTATSEQSDDTSGRPATPTKPPFILQSPYDKKLDEGKLLPTIDPEDIIGKSSKLPPNKDGSRDTATFTEIIQEFKDDVERHPDLFKFKFSVKDEVYDNLVSNAQALEYLSEEDAPDDTLWKFRRIIGHRGALTPKDKGYKRSRYNLMIEWEDGSTPEEGLQAMIIDDKMSCYEYGELHGLLNEEGWKKLKRCAHYIEQTPLKIFKATTVYNTRFEPSIQFGVQVPCNHKEAIVG
jgi:hypothetical protein